MIENKTFILKIDLETLTIGMSCLNSLGKILVYVSHSLVVRIPASGAGGLGSYPGGVTCDIEEKIETVLMGYSGAGGKLIDEKKTGAKNLVTLSL